METAGTDTSTVALLAAAIGAGGALLGSIVGGLLDWAVRRRHQRSVHAEEVKVAARLVLDEVSILTTLTNFYGDPARMKEIFDESLYGAEWAEHRKVLSSALGHEEWVAVTTAYTTFSAIRHDDGRLEYDDEDIAGIMRVLGSALDSLRPYAQIPHRPASASVPDGGDDENAASTHSRS